MDIKKILVITSVAGGALALIKVISNSNAKISELNNDNALQEKQIKANSTQIETISKVTSQIELKANTDINNLQSEGYYYTSGGYAGSTVSKTVINKPSAASNAAFTLIVKNIRSVSAYDRVFLQKFYGYNGYCATRVGYVTQGKVVYSNWS